jgi:large subunit ribosomal protein L15
MDLSKIHHGVHKLRRKKRVGRGIGSGHGKTSTRGSKGQWASAGAHKPPAIFEGGQMPLFRRIPKRGFSTATWAKRFLVVNVGDLDQFANGDTVDRDALRKAGLAKGSIEGIRILGNGELT